MKAIVQHAYGSADELKLEDVDRPHVADGEVLIRVRAAAVNHADWVYVSGRPLIARLAFGLRRPKTIVRGRDVAGVVEAVGTRVTKFRVGDEVFSEVDAGSFAEYTTVAEDLVALKPANLSFEQAATVPVSARTALQGLRDGGNLQAGQKVLINGASGGVGTFAIQIAKALGAEVTGVCSARNADLARSLGADHVIDYTEEDFTAGAERYDLIFDSIGNHSLTPAPTRPDTHRNAGTFQRHRRPRSGTDGSHRHGTRAVAIRQSEPAHLHVDPRHGEPESAAGTHRGRQGHAGDRPHLPPE